MSLQITQQAGRFFVVGAIGFLIDGGILTLLHEIFAFSLLNARLVSFAAAVTATWYLNRQHTFASNQDAVAINEWGRYATVNGIGALLNLGIFLWLVSRFAALANWPILALALAASVALIFNFFASRHFAFRHGQS